MRPIAIPATGRAIGTPASIRDKLEPQTDAIDDDPFDSKMSETTRIVYGKSSCDGSTGTSARSASAPCPMSRRLGPRMKPASPTENGGEVEWWEEGLGGSRPSVWSRLSSRGGPGAATDSGRRL